MQKQGLHRLYARPILLVAILLMLSGVYSYTQMPTSLFPEVKFPRITVIAEAGQQPIDRMMTTVTKPIESAVKKVEGVTVVKSSTSRSSCVVDVYFRWGGDIQALKSQVESRIGEIKGFLPSGTVISTEVMTQELFPVYGLALESKTDTSGQPLRSRIEMRDVANLIVRPQLSQVSGISNVVVRGGRAKEFVVKPDVARMTALGITLQDIRTAFDETNRVESGGEVVDFNRLYLTLTDTRKDDVEALRNIVVKADGRRTVRVCDVATVEIQEQQEFLKINADGQDAVLIDLVKQPGVNLTDFTAEVEKKVEEIRRQLPAGYVLQPYYNQGAFVGDSVGSVLRTIFEGLALALCVMVLFLRSWRASLVVMLTIPVTVAVSILLCHLAGITINVMSLGAMAASVGLIIDDAIVIVEQIFREQEEATQGRFRASRGHQQFADRFTVVRRAIRMLFPAMVASSLSTIVIHFPFRLMSGLAGSFFRELSDTMMLTLVASFFVTWLLLPVLYLLIGNREKGIGNFRANESKDASPACRLCRVQPKMREANNWADALRSGKRRSQTILYSLSPIPSKGRSQTIPYSLSPIPSKGRSQLFPIPCSLFPKLYRRPLIPLAFVVLLCAGGWYASTQLQSGFLPELDEGTIVLDYHSPAGTDIEETDRLCRQMERIIMAHPDVQTYSRRTAMGMSFKTRPSNFGDYLIQLKTNRRKSTSEVIADLRRQLSEAVPLITIDFGQRISDLLGDLMSTPKPIEVKIFGDDYARLQQLAAEAEQVMKQVDGVVDIDNGLVPAGASVVFTPHEDRLREYGLTLIDLQDQLAAHTAGIPLCQPANIIEPNPAQAAMTGGLQIGSVQEGEQIRRILLRFTDFDDNSVERLRQCPIFLPSSANASAANDGGEAESGGRPLNNLTTQKLKNSPTTRPLSFFCDMTTVGGEIEQRREDLKSCITLTARLEGRDLGSAVSELKQRLGASISLPSGYTISYGGAYAEQQQSFKELLTILVIAIGLVLTVLMFLFRAWRVSLSVLFVSVVGVCGCFIALWLTGVPLNVSSYTGIIMVVGIIAENAIFTVWQATQWLSRASRPYDRSTVSEAVDYAIALRLRPKLMTAIGAVLALMPLALGFGLGAQMQQPLAVAVIGGFAVGLPLLLVVLPALLLRVYK